MLATWHHFSSQTEIR